MPLLITTILIVLIGLYSQTNYVFSTNWFRWYLNYCPYKRRKLVSFLLRFWPFYHGRDFKDIRYLTISVFYKSWKKYGTGYQWSPPRDRQFMNGAENNSHEHCWFGIHILGLVAEFHFSWDHKGPEWLRL